MRIVKTLEKIYRILHEARCKGLTIGFVPTMGYFHEGHLSLMRQAKKECDICVVSIYVNPKQFGPKEDLSRYPRDIKRDATMIAKENVDILFIPSDNVVYPNCYLTYIDVEKISNTLCGKYRPGHFKGVATVVAKLLNMVQPDVMYLGQKDAQQVVVLKTMAADLNFPVFIRVVPTSREKDGLAMSSRNVHLSESQRVEAPVLYKALADAARRVKQGEHSASKIISSIQQTITQHSNGKIQYVVCVDADTLEPLKVLKGKVLIALAVFLDQHGLLIMSSLKKQAKSKIRVGILGCGAIGSRIAKSIKTQCDDHAIVAALFDINPAKAQNLQKHIPYKNIVKKTYSELLNSSDLIVEAVNAPDTHQLVKSALLAKKDVLVMSVGKFIEGESILKLAQKQGVRVLIPSGAIAGIDAIKAASLQRIDLITLTTRKPIYGFADNAYIQERRINLSQIKKETILFDGNVREAVKCFPQNINVAATIALASNAKDKLRIRIATSPEFKVNSHEIEVVGEFGRLVTKTENVVCPDNPKTSYLAVLSAVRTLKEYFQGVKIGT